MLLVNTRQLARDVLSEVAGSFHLFLASEEHPAQTVDEHYRSVVKTERVVRHIKAYFKIRPVYRYTGLGSCADLLLGPNGASNALRCRPCLEIPSPK